MGLAGPARSSAQLRLSTRIAINAQSATGSTTELLGTESHALLSFSNRWLGAGAHSLGLANPSRSLDKLRLSTQVAIITGSATDSITELLGTEALALLVKGSGSFSGPSLPVIYTLLLFCQLRHIGGQNHQN